jgi:hypothetical protein
MRRIILMLVVAAVMTVLAAAPAFAGLQGAANCTLNSTTQCTSAHIGNTLS